MDFYNLLEGDQEAFFDAIEPWSSDFSREDEDIWFLLSYGAQKTYPYRSLSIEFRDHRFESSPPYDKFPLKYIIYEANEILEPISRRFMGMMLDSACRKGNVYVLETMKNMGIDIANIANDVTLRVSLLETAYNHHQKEIVEILLDLEVRARDGYSGFSTQREETTIGRREGFERLKTVATSVNYLLNRDK